MSLAHRYQEFGSGLGLAVGEIDLDGRDLEDEKLKSFEEGFQAGWEDSLKAQIETKQKVSSDFAKNLQEISFGYHEARHGLLKSLRPLFEEIFKKLMPATAYANIGTQVVDQLNDMVRDQSDQLIEIVVSPINQESIQGLMEQKIPEPFVVLSQTDLAEGQVYIRIGSLEREINMDHVIEQIQQCADNLFEQESVDD